MSIPRRFALSSYDYAIADELIAQTPPPTRRASRLLNVCASGASEDLSFPDIRTLLAPGDLLVVNNTRVIPARLRGAKASGGQVEVFLERAISAREAEVQIKASRAPRPSTEIFVAGQRLTVNERRGRFFSVTVDEGQRILDLFTEHGDVPLPPYIRRDAQSTDVDRYQTVYARHDGAVAAPTAGLHFDSALLDELRDAGIDHVAITLHVGAGTFHPVNVEDVREHEMHAEWIEVSEDVCERIRATREAGGRVVAVGTTVVRALETAVDAGGNAVPVNDLTRIFIGPGHVFHNVDVLITNFHLPRSTLLMLVTAFAGYDRVMAAYRHAVDNRYRFFSYGDAMVLYHDPNPSMPDS